MAVRAPTRTAVWRSAVRAALPPRGPEVWRGDIRGRLPLLRHKKALITQTTIFDERACQDGLEAAMKLLVAEYCLRFPGVKAVEHRLFHAVHGADEATCRGFLDEAYRLGREF